MSNDLKQKSEVFASTNRQKTQSKAKLLEERRNTFKTEYSTEDHAISLRDLEQKYETNIRRGLTLKDAQERLLQHGRNCLSAPPKRSNTLLFLQFMFCGFNILLWAAVVMGFVMYVLRYTNSEVGATDQLYFVVVVVFVILFTAVFGFFQEAANVAIIEGFQNLIPKSAIVIRDGRFSVISSEEVVLGDLIELRAGEWIPADLRIVQSQSLKVDNSAITGESEPQSRSVEYTDDNPLESKNMVFYSTCIIEGRGRGIVIRRGDDTIIGNIAGLTTTLEKGETPIRREINYFIKFITILAVGIATIFFIICMFHKISFITSFTYFIALIIANVPEGLPVTLTACMTLTSKRMASKNCMVKKLEAIETLGCTTVICSDKTGTLTQNKMRVVHLFYDNHPFYVLIDDKNLNKESEGFKALCRVAVLCNTAAFEPEDLLLPVNDRRTIGDASESAILKSMEWLHGNVMETRENNPKVCEIPFNSKNKYQISIHKVENRFIVVMKGAPERILERCITILSLNNTIELVKSQKEEIMKAINNLGREGERVLAFADYLLPESQFGPDYLFSVDLQNFPLTGLRFVGLISMMDPPRPAVPTAVATCLTAGIRVIMVTGDHPLTASAIAKQVGILSKNSITAYDIALQRDVAVNMITEKEISMCNAAVVTGQDLREMSLESLRNIVIKYNEIVFARTSPQQKLKIVEAFQSVGHVVAVTGDGVNDSPALKKADIGIAMGISGSDVSKEAADMLLLDDNFSSIVTGIEEGRLIFDNLKKSIAYLLTSNVPEIVPFIVMIFGGFPPAISILSIMVIDVGTDLMPAISLAYEKPEADIMTRHPRDPNYDKLVNHRLILLTYAQIGVIQTCASFTAYFMCMMSYGFFPKDLINKENIWQNSSSVLQDSYGQDWNYDQRVVLTKKGYSALFLSIVITQVADLLICKTRRLSLFQQGMSNWVLNAGILVELCIAFAAVYVPGVRMFLQFEPINLNVLLPSIPFALMIFSLDEIRKLVIRKFPGGLIDRETYY